jgi:hypothetical protein
MRKSCFKASFFVYEDAKMMQEGCKMAEKEGEDDESDFNC